ncbi:hypothetical protein E2C01_008623 [Portunus trituberculatus]|uniref:Uncharacterized protein n=1 Tax=Portunus trituberculatus TaxID=210409 RepID=A0A5B7D2C0_PORTR|nr:hypothetical protein [Portunus trituberculatus]
MLPCRHTNRQTGQEHKRKKGEKGEGRGLVSTSPFTYSPHCASIITTLHHHHSTTTAGLGHPIPVIHRPSLSRTISASRRLISIPLAPDGSRTPLLSPR